jgi:hypothetical protein
MAENKNSILVYADWLNVFEELEDDEAGRLIKHFFRYVNDLNPEPPDRLTKIAFEPIKQSLKRDLDKWETKKGERSLSGRLGNLKKYTPDLYKQVSENQITIEAAENIAKHRKTSLSDDSDSNPSQTIANIAVSVSDSVSVSDILLEKESKHSLSNNITLEEKKAKIFEKNNERKAAMHGGSDSEAKQGGSNTIAVVKDSPYGTGELHHRVREWAKANPGKHEAEVFKDFLGYWTATVQKGRDRGRELWKTKLTFEIGQRLATWAKNEKQSNQNGNKANTNPTEYLTKTARELEEIFNSPNSSHHAPV